jgi:NAD(P)-dependent dehydrogenase (short-subunit alcohol dehydrogenase family)
VLINNAGALNPALRFEDMPAKEFDRVVGVNLIGAANVIRHFLAAMKQKRNLQGNGTRIIVNFSSRWGHKGGPRLGPYCMTKWAIEGLTAALANELPSHLAIYAVDPQLVNTAMLRQYIGKGRARDYPTPRIWAQTIAVDFILNLSGRSTRRRNGISLQMDGAWPHDGGAAQIRLARE